MSLRCAASLESLLVLGVLLTSCSPRDLPLSPKGGPEFSLTAGDGLRARSPSTATATGISTSTS